MRPLTLVSWNVENAARLLRAPNDLLTTLGNPDVLCVQEVRVRPCDAELVAAMEGALPGYVCHHALADDPRNVTFRGGRMYGVATYARRALGAVALPSPAWDREGRVAAIELPAEGIAVLNVYAVNGTDKPYFDHALGRVEGDRHAYKQRFIHDLAGYAQTFRDRGLRLVLAGDWNVSRAPIDATPRLRTEEPHATARRRFNEEFIPSLDLADVFRELHTAERAYTWRNQHARRLDAARVDIVLVSRELRERVVEASIGDEGLGSDHVPVALHLR